MIGAAIQQARQDHDFSLAKMAAVTQLPLATVTAWESGTQFPRQRDLALLDRLWQTNLSSVYQKLQPTYKIGSRASLWKVALAFAGLAFFDYCFTGFGRQPWYIFMAVLVPITFVTLPVFFSDFWQLTDKGLLHVGLSDNMFVKTVELVQPRLRETTLIPYQNIDQLTLKYQVRTRTSPIDLWPDYFDLIITVEQKPLKISLADMSHRQQLTIITDCLRYFSAHDVVVQDPQQICLLLEQHVNLYEHFHEPAQLNHKKEL